MQNKSIIIPMIFIGMVINASNYIESILIPAISKDFGLEIQQAGIIATVLQLGLFCLAATAYPESLWELLPALLKLKLYIPLKNPPEVIT